MCGAPMMRPAPCLPTRSALSVVSAVSTLPHPTASAAAAPGSDAAYPSDKTATTTARLTVMERLPGRWTSGPYRWLPGVETARSGDVGLARRLAGALGCVLEDAER